MNQIGYPEIMTHKNTWHRRAIRAIQLQLFITLVSLPFLIAWGLPISILTPISTLMFGPFLTLFLLFSSFIFFTQLLSIPNAVLIWCLNQITSAWLMILQHEQHAWLFGFAKPSMWWLLAIPLATLLTIHYKKSNNPKSNNPLLAPFFITVFMPYHRHRSEATYRTQN